jgi:uncharacterized membrane protein
MVRREWFIRRNRSLTPRRLVRTYLVLHAISLLVASFFVLNGACKSLRFQYLRLRLWSRLLVRMGVAKRTGNSRTINKILILGF